MWRRLSLIWKTRLILGGISAVSLVGMLLGLSIFREVYARFNTMVHSTNRLELLVNQVSDKLHTASRDEYAYMVSRKDEMLDRRAKAFVAIDAHLDSLESMDQNLISKDKLHAFARDVQNYQDEFKTIVQRLNTEGSLQDGLINDLRRANNDIENVIKANQGPDQGQTMTLYLNVRRQRTDYMASRNPEFLAKASTELEALHQFLETAKGFTDEQKQVLINASRLYVNTLVKVDVNYKDMMEHRNNQEKLLTTVEAFIAELTGKLAEHNANQLQTLEQLTRLATILFAVAFAISGILVGMASLEFTRLTERLTHIVNDIKSAVSSALKTSKTLNKSAVRSLGDSKRQAKQIEQTTQTLQEVAQSVLTNVNHARDSLKNADETVGVAAKGKTSVQQMRQTIKDIEASIQQMLAQSHESNQQMAGITQIISKISERTHVIDDIVFQTKLLSFNASVEAARAGEHGRGFAVVAEEVGALAQLSGKAAREINALLQSSQGEVLGIIKHSQEQMGLLMEASRTRVNQGVVVADNCSVMLGDIVDHVTFLRDTMNQICRSAEKESGDIQTISQTMLDVQQIAGAQADSAHQVSATSEEVNAEAAQLKASVNLLSNIVFGKPKDKAPVRVTPAPPPAEKPTEIDQIAS